MIFSQPKMDECKNCKDCRYCHQYKSLWLKEKAEKERLIKKLKDFFGWICFDLLDINN